MENRRHSTFTPFLRRFTDERAYDLQEMLRLYERVRAKHRASAWASPHAIDTAAELVLTEASATTDLPPAGPVRAALFKCIREVITAEDTIFASFDIDWERRTLSLGEQVDLCRFFRAQEWFLDNHERVFDAFIHKMILLCGLLSSALPEDAPAGDGPVFTVPLITLVEDSIDLTDFLSGWLLNEEHQALGLFSRIAARVYENACTVSGAVPYQEHRKPLTRPANADLTGIAAAEAYLAGTPLLEFLKTPVPFVIPEQSRFEHHWIVAGSGHGKTQTLQHLISCDLPRVANSEMSVVVIDSQGDLIRNLSQLQFFADNPGKLVLIDPTDIEWPVALNLFDVGMDRIEKYSPLNRERTLNSILELYDFVIGSLLSAELTQKQGVIFRYITRLMLHIPNATIQTFRELMEPRGYEKYRLYIDQLRGTARAFFETEFNSKQFDETKRQVVRRLWGILENATFERMFSHPRSKLNLFEEMNSGKVILINTAKELLKQQGTEIFGRFFVAMIAQAAQERATLGDRMPTIVYVDEAQDYFDANVGLILEQARKFKVGMVLAHQYIGQLSPKLQESFAANTSIKFAGGVSDRDARVFTGMLRCGTEFIEHQPKGHFAAYIRNTTKEAISLRVPFGSIEALPKMSELDWIWVRERIRERYSVPYAEVEAHISAGVATIGSPGTGISGASGAASDSAKGRKQEAHTDPDNLDPSPTRDW